MELHPAACGLPLSSYLMEPVQRIPRYGMLLDEAAKRCPSDDGDLNAVAVVEPARASLRRAADAVKRACAGVDDGVRNAETVATLSVAWRMPWLAVPHRVLLHRCPLVKSTKRRKTRKVIALVCNDVFALGQGRTGGL